MFGHIDPKLYDVPIGIDATGALKASREIHAAVEG